ncbi:thiamine phosphate synthase [Heyndrickxia acidicola]|uniref:Thiamine phosphate synthase n=1 Tax=Heyndrickxia acidicola TaxID=209389 RepID=A0ABU6MGF1_9BACI|nr:thiamine phosphate synthase [Heyndrickxia acidicola]MED1203570.1 thiamine phosphate synthase [Heyndrickxia acidicola]
MITKNKELHLVSNGNMSLQQFVHIAEKIHPYVTDIQLREKTSSAIELWEALQQLKDLGVPSKKLYVNDRVDIASAAQLKGVQLAFHSLGPATVKKHFPHLRIGKSVHSVKEAIDAEEQGADYLLFGHIFPSSSKPGMPSRGLEALSSVTSAVAIPVIAIGGIELQYLPDVFKAGAAGVAVMSGILNAKDPLQAAIEYAEGINGGGKR